MLITGLAIRLLIQQRRFKRRGLGGLQHFNNFFVGLLTLFLEWVLKWSAIALIVMGIIKIIT
ncbi:MAG: hypothetical protein P0Y53_01410 [Candidatus Pseudobacter hemicellulosilyticus]|uniref:Uncharacterized protein n=1 Tax=Candidatus Pseudobacter hemicellulosilyticus TaxID=3121375 RepID=A0AAJ5WSV2_9BACT|nr:MAG: hypothetical protein P0Y53_01410 [Pseudobacter sp.]